MAVRSAPCLARRPGGLGPTIAYELAASQGGRLEIDTAPGEGFGARLALRGG